MSNDHNSQEILVCFQVENNNAEAGGVAGEEPGEEGGAGRAVSPDGFLGRGYRALGLNSRAVLLRRRQARARAGAGLDWASRAGREPDWGLDMGRSPGNHPYSYHGCLRFTGIQYPSICLVPKTAFNLNSENW